MAKGAARGYTERMSGTEPTPAGSAGAGLLPEQWVQMIEICPEAVLVKTQEVGVQVGGDVGVAASDVASSDEDFEVVEMGD